MCSSRISRAASTTDADALIERGLSVIVSRTLFPMMSPFSSCAGGDDIARLGFEDLVLDRTPGES
jgi:hypothetical protein